VAIKNGQSIETDNCITTITYFLSFRVSIFAYQAQLINTEILNDKIKRNIKKKLNAYLCIYWQKESVYQY